MSIRVVGDSLERYSIAALGGMSWAASLWLGGSRAWGVRVVLSWVGCSSSRLVALVSVVAGSVGTGNPFVEVEAEVTTFGALRVCSPGIKGESLTWSELLQALQSMAFGMPVKVSRYNWTSPWPQLMERLWEALRQNSISYKYHAILQNLLADSLISCW